MTSYAELPGGDTPVDLRHAPIDLEKVFSEDPAKFNAVVLVHAVRRCEERLEYEKEVPFVKRALESLEKHKKFHVKLVLFSAIFQDLTWGDQNTWEYWQRYLENFFTAFEMDKEMVDVMVAEVKEEEKEKELKDVEPIDPFHGMVLFGLLYGGFKNKPRLFYDLHYQITMALLYGNKRAGVLYLLEQIKNNGTVVSIIPTPSSPLAASIPRSASPKPSVTRPLTKPTSAFIPLNPSSTVVSFSKDLILKLGRTYPRFEIFDYFMKEIKIDKIDKTVKELSTKKLSKNRTLIIAPFDFILPKKEWGETWANKEKPKQLNKLTEFRLKVLMIASLEEYRTFVQKDLDPLNVRLHNYVMEYLQQITNQKTTSGQYFTFMFLEKGSPRKEFSEFESLNGEVEEEDFVSAYNVAPSERNASKNKFVEFLLQIDNQAAGTFT